MIHIVRDRAARRQATAYSPHIIHQSWLKDGHQVPDRTRQTEHGVIEPGLGCIVVTWYSLFCSPGGLFRKDSRRRRDRMTERERERERVCVCVCVTEQPHANMCHVITRSVETTVLQVEPWHESCTTSENMHEPHHRQKREELKHKTQHATHRCMPGTRRSATKSYVMGSQSIWPKQPSKTDSYRWTYRTQTFLNSSRMCFH